MVESRIEGAVQYAMHQGRKDRAETKGDDPYPLNRYLLTENALLAAGFTRAEIIGMTEAEYAYAHGSVQSGYAHGWGSAEGVPVSVEITPRGRGMIERQFAEQAGDGGCADESPNPARAQRINRNVAGWRDRL